MSDPEKTSVETMAETDNYIAWKSAEPDGEDVYHLELNNVTLHFFIEEWQEFIDLIQDVIKKTA